MRPRLDDAVVPTRGRHHQPTFDNVMRDRLFDIHMLACLTSGDGCERMPMIGRRNNQAVDRRIVQDGSVVAGHLRGRSARFLDQFHRWADDGIVDVAKMRDSNVGNLQEMLGELKTANPQPHESNGHFACRVSRTNGPGRERSGR